MFSLVFLMIDAYFLEGILFCDQLPHIYLKMLVILHYLKILIIAGAVVRTGKSSR